MPGVPASSRTFLLFLLSNQYVFVCYPYVACVYSYMTRMLPVCTRMSSYVIDVYPYVLVWCFSHNPFSLSSFGK